MKKIITALCLLICLLTMISCSHPQKDILHLGVNATITEIDTSNKTITVKGSDEEGFLGAKCLIDCSKIPMIYCNYDTGEVKEISIKDLQVSDEVILSIRSPEITALKNTDEPKKTINIEQLQLSTQRIK